MSSPTALALFMQLDAAYQDALEELATLERARGEALLRAAAGMSNRDLAAATGLSVDQVRRVLAQAKALADCNDDLSG